jgi:hypothetical protein
MLETALSASSASLAGDHRRWRSVRAHLNAHRGELTALAARLYPGSRTLPSTRLLVAPGWVPPAPIPLGDVTLRWCTPPPAPDHVGTKAFATASRAVRARRTATERFDSYAVTIAALDPPRIFDDRPSYRLLRAHTEVGAAALEFTTGHYFDAVDVGEACAHELARTDLDGERVTGLSALPLREHIGDPTRLEHRPALLGVSVLTIRADAHGGEPAFLVHLRDARKVATGGGQFHVIPVGLFQPPPGRPAVADEHFDLWRLIGREFAEEVLGCPEQRPEEQRGPEAERATVLLAGLAEARDAGRCRPYYLGLGVDPLMLATDVMIAAVFDAATFDALLGGFTAVNDEGALARHGQDVWFPFAAQEVRRIVGATQAQPACAGALALAWQGREHLGVG